MDDQVFDDQCPQDESNPQIDAAEAGLHVAKATDHRDFDVWAADESYCQRFLTNRPSTWRTAIQRYWRERCTRRELAEELGLNLESTKNLLRRIRKAARDTQNGTITLRLSHNEEGVRYPGRPHCGINTRDIEAICDGDEDALAYCAEYGRLNVIERLKMFSPAISGELVKTFQHADAIGHTNEAITSGLVAKSETLKAKIVKPDPFMNHPVVALFADECTRMKIPDTDEGCLTRWKARTIGRSEAEPIGRGRPRKEAKPATAITTAIKPARKHARPRKTDLTDLRVITIPPSISHGRAYSLDRQPMNHFMLNDATSEGNQANA